MHRIDEEFSDLLAGEPFVRAGHGGGRGFETDPMKSRAVQVQLRHGQGLEAEATGPDVGPVGPEPLERGPACPRRADVRSRQRSSPAGLPATGRIHVRGGGDADRAARAGEELEPGRQSVRIP